MAKWKELYKNAVLETNPTEMDRLIGEAETALLRRISDLTRRPDHNGERKEIADASAALIVLKREKLGWRNSSTHVPASSLTGLNPLLRAKY